MIASIRKQGFIALSYFFIIAVLGCILRLIYVVDIPVNYRYLVHAHSHVALLGWVYTALAVIIHKKFLQESEIETKYQALFIGMQISLIGMLITFPIQGYALLSIIFSTLFILLSYYFSYLFFRYTPVELKRTFPYRFIRTGLWFMIISSIGPWALGIIMNTLGAESVWYRNAIYFYLHFQYNGWFIMGILGLSIYLLQRTKFHIPRKSFSRFFQLSQMGIALSLLLSFTWMAPNRIIFFSGGLGVLLQIAGLIIIAKPLYLQKDKFALINPHSYVLLKWALVLYSIKLLMQLLSAIPAIGKRIAVNPDLIIGYLHLNFLGIVSLALLGLLIYHQIILPHKKAIQLYMIAFCGTEIMLFYKALVNWQQWELGAFYYPSLAIVSILFPISIGMLLYKNKALLATEKH